MVHAFFRDMTVASPNSKQFTLVSELNSTMMECNTVSSCVIVRRFEACQRQRTTLPPLRTLSPVVLLSSLGGCQHVTITLRHCGATHLSATDHPSPSTALIKRESNMSEFSDMERLRLVDRVNELKLNDAQKSILSDMAMNCQRGDANFLKLKMIGTFWGRHGYEKQTTKENTRESGTRGGHSSRKVLRYLNLGDKYFCGGMSSPEVFTRKEGARCQENSHT